MNKYTAARELRSQHLASLARVEYRHVDVWKEPRTRR